MRTIIAGSRDVWDYELVEKAVGASGITPTVVLSGGASGVDTLGEDWAYFHGVPVEKYPAQWSKGKGAGLARNTQMAHNAQALIAIWDGRSPGTHHMIQTARNLGLVVFVLPVEGNLDETDS